MASWLGLKQCLYLLDVFPSESGITMLIKCFKMANWRLGGILIGGWFIHDGKGVRFCVFDREGRHIRLRWRSPLSPCAIKDAMSHTRAIANRVTSNRKEFSKTKNADSPLRSI